MNIKLRFTAQIKDVVGNGADTIVVNDGAKLQDLLKKIAGKYGEKFESILFDENNGYRHSNLIVINQSQISYEDNVTLTEGDEVTLMSPISGG
ncbi:MoaD/ThiS family protein [Flavivirga spongiicola]|uniref:MoaD/ThiS family protein n=1 Tax=Flavivirga spongiicola TaxID=421621 RepID=A0ABU7XPN9_9FLAO|nr:MoaD/ThiS family protein [Flavivirga sp. MEBiC05379]MDO5977413.1 MoaD/ThiS family protein [Flavivirga sp. MEBiC05379]